jgi:Fe-S cluster assembly protein SufD
MTDSSTNSVLYRSATQQLEQRVDFDGPTWLAAYRRQAAAWFRRHGLPHSRDEAWRFTPLAAVTEMRFTPASPSAGDPLGSGRGEGFPPDVIGAHLANGRYYGPFGPVPAGVEIRSLAELIQSDPDWVKAHLGAAARLEHGFAALNAALFEDGIVVRVRPGVAVDRPIELVLSSTDRTSPVVDQPRVLVVAERDSRVELVETHAHSASSRVLSNFAAEIVVGEHAAVTHAHLYLGDAASHRVARWDVHQKAGSRYTSHLVTFGGALSRVDLSVRMTGADAECRLHGLYLASGTDHVDHHTVIDHVSPRCTSHEVYRGILAERGRSVFDGIVKVRPGAQHTNAHQENKNLLLSDHAIANTKPHLEIEADDVRCSHGATAGRLDPEQLFYLRSRGIGRDEAHAMLVRAFARDVIDAIPFSSLRAQVGQNLERRLRMATRSAGAP